MKKLSLVLALVFFVVGLSMAQRTVTGTLTDVEGETLIGASVLVKGTTSGTVTDFDGKYSLAVPEGAKVLVYSYTGFESQEIALGATNIMDVVLVEGVTLSTAVVVALGISREEKSLGYSVQEVDGADLVKARESNVINALNGKVAGVHITNSSGSVGSSSRITLRGAASITGDNQPLFVIDGIPINNTNYGTADSGGGFDVPDGVSDLNPDDIESISVLKGPNAAAIYGIRAANGVIIITTKKGEFSKGLGISFNSSFTTENPLLVPDFQNSYGQGSSRDNFEFIDGSAGDGGVDESWGPPLDVGLEFVQWNSDGKPAPWVSSPNNIKDFYDTGKSINNNLSFTGGSDNLNYRLSLGSTNQTGIVPNTNLDKYTVKASSSAKLGDKFTAGVNVSYVKTKSGNLPTGGYNNENPVQQMIWSGRQINFADLKDYENLPLAAKGTAAEGTPLNWNTRFQNNPYWVQDNNLNKYDKNRIIGAVDIGYQFTDFLSFKASSSVDNFSLFISQQKAVGSNEFRNGFYSQWRRDFTELNHQALLLFNKSLSDDIDFSLNLGVNRMDRSYKRLYGEAGALELPGVYNLGNIRSGSSVVLTNANQASRINSAFFAGSIGFKNAIYIDFSGRNDWSSVMPIDNNSFFYPSVNLSVVVSDLMDINSSVLSFLKVRGGWSKVGSSGQTSPYDLQQTYGFRSDPWGSTLLLFNPSSLKNPNLTPESVTGIEFGIDTRLFNNKLRLDFTYYNQTSKDLIVNVAVSAASGYTTTLDNVGEMNNSGIELQLGATLFKSKDFEIDANFNFAKNKNEVVSLGDVDALILGGQWNVDVQARTGLPFGVIFGPGYERTDAGDIIYEDGVPVTASEFKVLGDIQPDWTGGMSLDIRWKSLTFNTIIDAKIGGEVYSMTTTWGRFAGVLSETLAGRENGIVGTGVMNVGTADEPKYVPNDVVVSAEVFNKAAYSNNVAEGSVFDASYVKWRQAMITYNLPKKWLDASLFQGASVSLVGRNLAILYRKTPHIDPETGFSNADGAQGIEFGQLPSVRSIGFNLNLKF